MEYRRTHIPGGTYFFTLVTYQRRPMFSSPDAVDTLRNAFQYTLSRIPFTIVASVIIPDHMHFIQKSKNAIKTLFTGRSTTILT
jgi:putative transposase